MKYTENYNLNKPELNEKYDVSKFNENADILDNALKNVEQNAGVKIDDTQELPEKTWSSQKIAEELSKTTGINDNVTSEEKTWSSQKINSEIDENSGVIKQFTKEQYDALTETEKNDGHIREIIDVIDEDFNFSNLYENSPIGTIFDYLGENIPIGFLLCNGQEVDRGVYGELFAVIGTKYGEGDGSTTFKIPDLREAVPEGAGQNEKQFAVNKIIHAKRVIGELPENVEVNDNIATTENVWSASKTKEETMQIYSEEETVIGEYFGKPLYKCVFNWKTPNVTGWNDSTSLPVLPNIRPIKYDGCIFSDDQDYIEPLQTIIVRYKKSTGKFNVNTDQYHTNKDAVLELLYTKTTD